MYHYLEEATRSTSYAASIKPFQHSKDGRGAWIALIGQYSGRDKWEVEIKKQEQLLHSQIWKGQSKFSLEHFITQHQNAFISMQACTEHVQYQLLNTHSRVGYLLDVIQCSEAPLQAVVASIQTNDGMHGMCNKFEVAVTHLVAYDSVAKKHVASSGNKQGSALILAAEGFGTDAEVAGMIGKPSISKTRVHLRFHKGHEFSKLMLEQKVELRQWCIDNPEEVQKSKAKLSNNKKTKFNKNQVSSMVAKKVQSALKKALSTEPDDGDDRAAYISSLVNAAVEKKQAATSTVSSETTKLRVLLKSILKCAQNEAQ